MIYPAAFGCKAITLVLSINPIVGKGGADRVRDIGGRDVSIMFRGHSRVAVSKLRGNDAHGNALHRERACIGVAQDVECRERV